MFSFIPNFTQILCSTDLCHLRQIPKPNVPVEMLLVEAYIYIQQTLGPWAWAQHEAEIKFVL